MFGDERYLICFIGCGQTVFYSLLHRPVISKLVGELENEVKEKERETKKKKVNLNLKLVFVGSRWYIYLCLSVYLFIRSDNFLIHYEIAFILFESIVQPVCCRFFFSGVTLVPVALFPSFIHRFGIGCCEKEKEAMKIKNNKYRRNHPEIEIKIFMISTKITEILK